MNIFHKYTDPQVLSKSQCEQLLRFHESEKNESRSIATNGAVANYLRTALDALEKLEKIEVQEREK